MQEPEADPARPRRTPRRILSMCPRPGDPLPRLEETGAAPGRSFVSGGFERAALQLAGLASLGLGALGLFLPVLPTTPFVLLASACFVRSSPALAQRLRRSRLLGQRLAEWERHRALRPELKRLALLSMTLGITLSLAYGNLPAPLCALLLALGLVGATVVGRLPTLREAGEGVTTP